MAWRGLHLSKPARLSLADGQVVVAQDRGETRLALEDVAWIIIETPQATISAALLSACMNAGIAIIITDERHMPNGVALPFHTHHRQAAVVAMQQAAGAGLRGRLWQAMVQGKIYNQADVLAETGGAELAMRSMAGRVLPGDPDNVEARAARYYWGELFVDFVRGDDGDLRNGMLNYGYAVLRAIVARALVAAGLVPAIGVHHASQQNGFNLADDVIEAFRPLADIAVWRMVGGARRPSEKLAAAQRQILAGLPLEPVRMGDETVTVLVAAEMAALSLVRAFEAGSVKLLMLPKLPAARAADSP